MIPTLIVSAAYACNDNPMLKKVADRANAFSKERLFITKPLNDIE
ncbi:hypothetical protein STBHUCCB_p2210 (plasmid) [Salmonella enterica subsp. enterica serovar Typhi str. P-stx-12]|nr:hypothetical protein STBHUCCB_p2210 [Salmonella enterica subsp. enterica serovar Typhi str. P-stx-12]